MAAFWRKHALNQKLSTSGRGTGLGDECSFLVRVGTEPSLPSDHGPVEPSILQAPRADCGTRRRITQRGPVPTERLGAVSAPVQLRRRRYLRFAEAGA